MIGFGKAVLAAAVVTTVVCSADALTATTSNGFDYNTSSLKNYKNVVNIGSRNVPLRCNTRPTSGDGAYVVITTYSGKQVGAKTFSQYSSTSDLKVSQDARTTYKIWV